MAVASGRTHIPRQQNIADADAGSGGGAGKVYPDRTVARQVFLRQYTHSLHVAWRGLDGGMGRFV